MTVDNKKFISKLLILSSFVIILGITYKILNILVILSISLFLCILISPILNKLNKLKINDFFGILLIYLFVIFLGSLFIFSIVPILIKQITLLSTFISTYTETYLQIYQTKGIQGFGLPSFIESYLVNIDISVLLTSIKANITTIGSSLVQNLSSLAGGSIGLLSSVTNTVLNIILIFTFTLFIGLERHSIRDLFFNLLSPTTRTYLLKKEVIIVDTLFSWIKSQFILVGSIFIITFLGLLSLRFFGIKIDEIFTLALIAGMMEFIPFIGPFIALIPAIAIGLGLGLKATLLIFALYILIQQLENNVLVPWVMGKSLSLSPFSVLLGMTIGASLLGIIGMIISIPFVAILQIFLKDYLKTKK